MENNAITKQFLPQKCWKEMLKANDILKLWKFDQNFSKTSQFGSKQSENECIQISLDQNLESFTYSIGSEQHKIDIAVIDKVTSEKDDLQSFSVELKDNTKVIFQAESISLAQWWVQGLQELLTVQTTLPKGDERRVQWLRERFQALSTRDHHKLMYDDVLKHVLNGTKIIVSPDFFQQKLKEFLKMKKLKLKDDDGFLVFGCFVEFYKFIFDRKEIVNLFRRVSSNGAFISASDLQWFLSDEQKESDVTQGRCQEIMITNEVTQVGRNNLELGIDGFTYFMLSHNGQLFNPEHDKAYQDMSQPLPHYYIASSHNTYLCGRQLRGESSPQAYTEVLEKGCRCVELDCWDGNKDEPIVYHGHTLTKKILFKDIIKAINDSAFKTSEYPVIVSLENHCGIEAQKKMADYMKEIFGDKMYVLPVNKNLGEFPSPEFFKNKILVRTKIDDEDDDDDDEQVTKPGIEIKREDKLTSSSKAGSDQVDGLFAKSSKATPPESPASTRKKIKKKVAQELSALINYISNAKFSSFDEADRDSKFWQSSSFVEGKMDYYATNTPEGFIRFNRRQLSRIYPGNMRIDSSNYSPIKPWNVGCQIVALNHQTDDEPMALYRGKFRQNSRAGYILKPSFLRDPSIKFNPETITKPVIGSNVLKMTIISGQQLPDHDTSWSLIKDEPDPYVYVQIHGVKADQFSFTTSTFYDNNFNPTWNERFETQVLVPELAMISFSVYDSDVGFDDFIGQAVLPFESMQQGYRHVPLENKEGMPMPCASIFIYVNYEQLKPDMN